MIIKCAECGNMFKQTPSKIKEGSKYCSPKCGYSARSREMSGEKNVNWLGGKIKKICAVCGVEFSYSRPYQTNRKCCSIKCKGILHGRNKREKSSNWKGGKTPDYVLLRNSDNYKIWRRKVFERDHFICRKCGFSGGRKIQAHHIVKFIYILNDIKNKFPLLSIRDIGIKHKELWDVDNGITLCKECHKLEHIKDKENGTTKTQL